MAHGPGKYDDICVLALTTAGAREGALIVLDGEGGPGFSVQMTARSLALLPGILRMMADDIEKDNATIPTDKDHPVQS